MNKGRTIFAQLMDCFLSQYAFGRIVDKHQGDRHVRTLTGLDQFRAMAFAQLTGRESLRDIQNCLSALEGKLYHAGFRGPVSRSTLARVHDVNLMDQLCTEAGAIYIVDRGYLDFERFWNLKQRQAFFVTRAKRNTQARRVCSREVDKSTGLVCDQTVVLTTPASRRDYPEPLRRIAYIDQPTGKRYVFLTKPSTSASAATRRRMCSGAWITAASRESSRE